MKGIFRMKPKVYYYFKESIKKKCPRYAKIPNNASRDH